MTGQPRIIRWEEPPPSPHAHGRRGRSGSKWDGVAAELVSRPGRSAVIHESVARGPATSLASYVNAGRTTCFAPGGRFQARLRLIGGVYVVFARYVGDAR